MAVDEIQTNAPDMAASAAQSSRRRSMGGPSPGDYRIGYYDYGPNGERIRNLRDGNAEALQRRKQDEINRGGPMAQMWKSQGVGNQNSTIGGQTSQAQSSAPYEPQLPKTEAFDSWARPKAGAGAGLLGGLMETAARATRTQAAFGDSLAGQRQSSRSPENANAYATFDKGLPSNMLQGHQMDGSGHYQAGTDLRGKPNRVYSTPTSWDALESRFPGYASMTPQERAATLRANRTGGQVGTVVDRGRVGNRGYAVAGGGMVLDGPRQGGGTIAGPMYAQITPSPEIQKYDKTFRPQVAAVNSAMSGVAPVRNSVNPPVRSAASAPVNGSPRDIFRPRIAATGNAMSGVIPARIDPTPPMRMALDLFRPKMQASNVAQNAAAGASVAQNASDAEGIGQTVGSYIGQTTRNDFDALKNFTVRPAVQAGRAVRDFAKGAWRGAFNPPPPRPQIEDPARYGRERIAKR